MDTFLYCKTCGKRLIKKDEDGTLVFRFGKPAKTENNLLKTAVEIHIRGTIRMKCLRRACDVVTEFTSSEKTISDRISLPE